VLNGFTEVEENTLVIEEICHKSLTAGNILRTKNLRNVKQELLARRKAHYLLIPFAKLKECFDEGLTEYYEVAEHLNVTEKFLREAVTHFKQKYGLMYYDRKTNCYFNFGNTIQIYKEDNSSHSYDYGC
uniref:ImmA/IrrE family metallo-endopeptidase n=1 Tax=Listeria valentina TaxID=2705293 RepID=UPI001430787E